MSTAEIVSGPGVKMREVGSTSQRPRTNLYPRVNIIKHPRHPGRPSIFQRRGCRWGGSDHTGVLPAGSQGHGPSLPSIAGQGVLLLLRSARKRAPCTVKVDAIAAIAENDNHTTHSPCLKRGACREDKLPTCGRATRIGSSVKNGRIPVLNLHPASPLRVNM